MCPENQKSPTIFLSCRKTKNGHHAFSKEDIATRRGLDTPIEAALSIGGLALPKAAKEALDRSLYEESCFEAMAAGLNRGGKNLNRP